MATFSKEQKQQILLLHQFASHVRQASQVSGTEEQYDRLREIIARQERQHRRLGRGPRPQLSVSNAVDLFVAHTIYKAACGPIGPESPIANLVGLREDFIIAAILYANEDFRKELHNLTLIIANDERDQIDYSGLLYGAENARKR